MTRQATSDSDSTAVTAPHTAAVGCLSESPGSLHSSSSSKPCGGDDDDVDDPTCSSAAAPVPFSAPAASTTAAAVVVDAAAPLGLSGRRHASSPPSGECRADDDVCAHCAELKSGKRMREWLRSRIVTPGRAARTSQTSCWHHTGRGERCRREPSDTRRCITRDVQKCLEISRLSAPGCCHKVPSAS